MMESRTMGRKVFLFESFCMLGWKNLLPNGQSSGEKFVEVFGGTFARLLRGHSSLCTDRGATSIYRTIDPQGFRTSMLATTRILVSRLARARVFSFCVFFAHLPQVGTRLPSSHALPLWPTKSCSPHSRVLASRTAQFSE